VQAKLSVLCVPEATHTRLAALVLQAASEPEQAKAVFTAALPLVQGKPTVAAVGALLLAVLRLDPENKELGDGELKTQAMEAINIKDDEEAMKKEAMLMIAGAAEALWEGKQSQSKIHPWKVKRASMITQTAAASGSSHRPSVTLGDEAAAASASAPARSTGKN
jgi:hypothetical protein